MMIRKPWRLARLLGMVLGLLLSSAALAQAPSPEAADVTQAAEQLRSLMLKPDPAALDALLADQLSYGHSDGRLQSKTEFVEALVSGKSVFHSITLTEQTVAVAGDVAIIRHRFAAEAVSNGQPGQPRIAVLQVWQKQGGVWKLLVRQGH